MEETNAAGMASSDALLLGRKTYEEFAAFWLSVYRTALPGDAPPVEMRLHTKSRPAGVDLPDDVPNHAGYSARFMAKLLAARISMLLRR